MYQKLDVAMRISHGKKSIAPTPGVQNTEKRLKSQRFSGKAPPDLV